MKRRAETGQALTIALAIGVVIACAAGCGGRRTDGGGSASEQSSPAQQEETRTPPPAARPASGPESPPTVEGQPVDAANGLRYIMIQEGTGATPRPGQSVSVHYTGWFEATGRKFDSSLDRGQPFQFVLGQGNVIQGWDQGVALMKVGEKRRFIIPPALAYGERGHPAGIPPNSTLIFDVELLDVR